MYLMFLLTRNVDLFGTIICIYRLNCHSVSYRVQFFSPSYTDSYSNIPRSKILHRKTDASILHWVSSVLDHSRMNLRER